MADSDTLPDVVVASTRELSQVITILTRRCEWLRERIQNIEGVVALIRGIQHRMQEAGFDAEAGALREAADTIEKSIADDDKGLNRIGDSLEIAVMKLAKERILLDVAATGSAEKTNPGHPSGEWRSQR